MKAATSKQLLLLDDDQKMAGSLTKHLGELHLQVTQAQTLSEALKLHDQKSFELILLSAELKSESGYNLLKKIKGEAKLKQVPVIITSAAKTATADFEKHRSSPTPAQGYLSKPYGMLDFLDLVTELVPLPDLLREAPKDQAEPLESEKERTSKKELTHQIEQLKQELRAQERTLEEKHKKAQTALRDFYRDKLNKLQDEAKEAAEYEEQVEELTATISHLKKEIKEAILEQKEAEDELEREKKRRKRIDDALKE